MGFEDNFYFVYVLLSEKDKIHYIGYTHNLNFDLLPVAGNHNNSNGSLNNAGFYGNYWSKYRGWYQLAEPELQQQQCQHEQQQPGERKLCALP